MTIAELAIATTHWDRVAGKAGLSGSVMAYATDKRVVVKHNGKSKPFDPSRDEWLTSVILWLTEEAAPA